MRYNLLAACMMHVEGYFSVKSRAFLNHNPGNIEHSDGTMQVYPDILTGYTALVNDIRANIGKTLNSFISKYAPPNQNNTSMYLQVVSTLSGIKSDEIL